MRRLVITAFQKLPWSVNRKINICLALLVTLIFISSVIVFFAIQTVEDSNTTEREESIDVAHVEAFDQQLRNTINIYNDAVYLNQNKAIINAFYQTQITTSLTQLKADLPEQLSDKHSNLSQILQDYTQLSQLFDQVNTFIQNAQNDQVTILWASNLELRRSITASSDQLHKQLEDDQAQAVRNSNFASLVTKITVITVGILGVLFAILCIWLLSETIGKPLAATRTFLEKLALGTFSEQLNLANRDELGDLARSLNISVITLRGIVESFDIGTDVESAAKNLRDISSEQAKHSSEQVGHISQVNVALQELATSAKAINDNASMVAQSADITLIQAQQVDRTTIEVGDIIMQLQTTVVEAGTSISQANQDFLQLIEQLQLVDQQNLNSQAIIKIIADIAREIHLLSLNAAIEAAGAGENGERFKVVAKQIKDLSIRSTASAKEVTDLLATTRQAVQQTVQQSDESFHSIKRVVQLGTELSALAQATLEKSEQKRLAVEEILRAATYSAQQAGQIAAATQQQQASSQQILATVGAISQVIDVSAERSHMVADTSYELDAMSSSLALRLAALKLPTFSQ